MKMLIVLSLALFSLSFAQAKTINSSFYRGSYTVVTSDVTASEPREVVTGGNRPITIVDCNGGQGHGLESDLKLISGESVTLKDIAGNFHKITCK